MYISYIYVIHCILHVVQYEVVCYCKLILKNNFLFQNFGIYYPFLANIYVFCMISQLD